MHVKTGDIVRYRGKTQRLMMCGTHIFRLSHDGNIGDLYHNLELVKSVQLPSLTDLGIKSENNWLIVTHAEKDMTEGAVPDTFNKVFCTGSIATPRGSVDMKNHDFDEDHQFHVRIMFDIIYGVTN